MSNVIFLEKQTVRAPTISVAKTALAAGLSLAGCLVVYFMILKFMNLVPVISLRIVDFLILGIGIFATFQYYRRKTKKTIPYLQGLLFGTAISAYATIPFALFMAVYFQWIDPQLLLKLKADSPLLGTYISPFKIAVTTIIGGLGWGTVLSFLLMQYFQEDTHHAKGNVPRQ